MDSESSSEDDDGSTDSDTDVDHNGSYSSEEDETDGLVPAVGRRRRRWERSEEEDRLRERIKRNESWEEMGKQLNGSASAVCHHWRLTRESRRGRNSLRKGGKRKATL